MKVDQAGRVEHKHPKGGAKSEMTGGHKWDQEQAQAWLEGADHPVWPNERGNCADRRTNRISSESVRCQIGFHRRENVWAQMAVGLCLNDVGGFVTGDAHPSAVDEPRDDQLHPDCGQQGYP